MPTIKLEADDGETLDEYEVPGEGHYRVEAPDGALICELYPEGE